MIGTERRRAPRVRAYRPVRLCKPSLPPVFETLTKDLSLDGMRCLSPTWFPVSSDLNVELTLSDGEEPLSVTGRAVWFRMIPYSDQFEVGFSFQGVPPQTKRRLSGYLDRLAVKTSPALA